MPATCSTTRILRPKGTSRGGLLAAVYPFLATLLLIGTLIFALLYFGTKQLIRDLFACLQVLGARASTAFAFIDMLVVILVLPGIVLTIGATSTVQRASRIVW